MNAIKNILLLISNFGLLFRFFDRESYVLILKIDAIGDYILFRNYLSYLKKSEKYYGKKFLFVGNVVWKEIYDKYDSGFAEKVIWVDRNHAYKYRLYRFLILFKINRYYIEQLLQPTCSRDNLINFFAINVKAKLKISLFGDLVNQTSIEKSVSDKSFGVLIPEPDGYLWEREKTEAFFSYLDPKIKNVELDLPVMKDVSSEPYICFFIGASEPFRSLSKDNLVFILKNLIEKKIGKIYLLGGKREAKLGLELSLIDKNIINLAGTKNLVESISVIGNSKATLSMDSAGVHIAMATKVAKVFCFSNGNHYSRFIPYPIQYKNLTCFFPPIIHNIYNNRPILQDSFYNGSLIPIDTIDLVNALKTIIWEIQK